LILGTLGEEQLLGGRVRLSLSHARKAFAPIAERLGQTIEAAALGALAIMTASIARAIKLVSLDRGHDPRRFDLIAFGGAGPMHAAQVAAELEMDAVIVPPSPGILCATGLLYAPVRSDFVRTDPHDLDTLDAAAILSTFLRLDEEARSALRQQGASGSTVEIRWLVGMNFVGQDHELTVELPRKSFDVDTVRALDRMFREEYQLRYAYSPPDGRARIVNCRVTTQWSAQEASILPPVPVARFNQHREDRVRNIYFEPGQAQRTRVYERSTLSSSGKIEGPAILVQLDSTTVVPPGWGARVDSAGNLILDRR
jgi:N-methylhydantoinase A